MTTLAAMIADIEEDLERSDTAAIRGKIAEAIRFYQPKFFWFNESRNVEFATVIHQSDYDFITSITTEFYTIDGAFLTEGGNILDMRKTDYRALEILLDANSTSAQPIAFAYVARGLRLYPRPNAVYPARLTGHIKIAVPLADDAAGNEWMTEAFDLIKARAKALLYATRYRDTDGAAIERVVEADALSNLQSTTASKVGTGEIRPTRL